VPIFYDTPSSALYKYRRRNAGPGSAVGGGPGGIASTGLYQIAANNFKIGVGTIASTGTLNECAGRSKHPIAGRYTSIKVAYHAWYFNTGATAETLATQWDIKKAALELGGTTVPILFSGGRTKSIDTSQAFFLSDAILPAAFGLTEFTTANCANLWHRIEATAAVGGTNHWAYMIPGTVSGTFSAKYAQANSLNQVDATGAMSNPTGASANGIPTITPLMIVGISAVGGQISVLGHGDSISVGAGTGFTQTDGGQGLICEALWNGGVNPIPGLLVGKISASASEYATSNAFRKAIMPYANVCLDQFGTNDIQVAGTDGPGTFAANKLIWEDSRVLGVQRVVQTKLMVDTDVGHSVTSLTQVGGVATCVIDDTSWMTGQPITITGAGTAGYNLADVTVTVVNSTTFTYAVAGGTATPSSTITLCKVGDKFRTKGGQSPKVAWVAGNIRDAANTLYGTALSDGTLDAYPDTLTPVSDPTDDHYWANNGTANYASGDGVHPNAVVSALASTVIHDAIAALLVDQNAAAPKNLRAAGITSVIPQEGVAITIDTYDIWKDIVGATLTYQWKRNGSAISGATSAGYTPVTADVGTTLTREKTYTNSFGSGTLTTTVGGYVWAADGLTRFLSDSFNGSATSDLNTHTADSGATWARNAALSAAVQRISAPRDGRAYSLSSGSGYMASPTPASANQTVYFQLDPLTTVANQVFGAMLRADATVVNGYLFAYSRAAGGWTISKLVTGTATVLATATAAITNGQRYSVKCVANGTALQMYVDGTQVLNITDSTYSVVGQIGLRDSGAGVAPTTGLGITELAAAC
jgi:hypothetical protein